MWEVPDILWSLGASRDQRQAAEPYYDGSMDIVPAEGFLPEPGQYIVDPDWMEVLKIDDPDGLLRFHK